MSKIIFIFICILYSSIQQDIIDISEYSYPKSSDTDYYRIALFGTNDIHGKIFPSKFPHPSGTGGYLSGGVEYIYKYIKILREEWGERFLWLDGGDQFQGGLEFMLSEAEIMNTFYNFAKVDAMAIGNHEFDFGTDFLKSKMAKSNFTYLVANLFNITTNENAVKDFPNTQKYKVFTVGKAKIGVIGLATVETPTTTSVNPTDLTFKDYPDIVKELAKELREVEKVDAVVLLPHFGPSCPDELGDKMANGIWNAKTTQLECDKTNEYAKLIENLPEGTIDAAVAAHVHDVSHHWIGGVPVVESNGASYAHVIYLTFKENEDGTLTLVKDAISIEGPLPACPLIFKGTKRCDYVSMEQSAQVGELTQFKFHSVTMETDAELEKLLDPWREMINRNLSEIILYNEEIMFTRTYNETALANLVTDIARVVTGADVSFFNLGGFRGNWYPGEINEVDIYNMFPFNNTFVTFEMTGRELIRMVKETQTGYSVRPSSGLIQVFRFTSQSQIELLDAKLFDGYEEKSIELDKTYIVCLNDFLANGGSFFAKVLKWYKVKNRQDHGIIREFAKVYLKGMEVIKKGMLVDEEHPRVKYLS